jgi:Protein of unknown function (DUF4241)
VRPVDPTRAFRYGEPLTGPHGRFVLERHELPPLALPSGRLVACDLAVEPDALPLAVRLRPGSYPVELSVARFDGGDQRVAFAALRLTPEPPVTWRPAALEGQDPAATGGRGLPGFGVDSATAAYYDADCREALRRWAERDPDWYGELADRLEGTYIDTCSWAVVPIPDAPGLNVALFSSGMGDGFYTTHLGHDGAGGLCCVATEFGIAGAGAPAGGSKPWWKFW